MNRRHFIYGGGAAIAASHLMPALSQDAAPGLKDLNICGGRQIGAWVDRWQMQDSLWRPVILRNFNLITLGRLKWGFLRPTAATYDFVQTDWMVAFCIANGLALHGHNLCWNASNPAWLEQTLTPANAEKMLTENISTVMNRYAGKISSYDVVNEPIANWMGRSDGLYTGPWLTALGPRYIDVAFHAAAAADPDALRVLNIAHVEQGGKGDDASRKLTLRLIETLLQRNVPVQAIGFESHLSGDVPAQSTSSRNSFVKRIRELGLKVLITELDVDDTRLTIDEKQNDVDVSRVYGDYLTTMVAEAQPSKVIFFTPGDTKNWYDRTAPDPKYTRQHNVLHRPGLFDNKLVSKPAYAAVAAVLKGACL